MNVSEYIISFLNLMEINYVFGLSGAKIEKFLHSVYKSDVSFITAKSEFSAAAMADAYSRCGRKFGVAAATSGGGAYNLIPALAESFINKTPLLAIVGQAENNRKLKSAFQETSGNNGTPDIAESFKPVTRLCRKVNSENDIPGIISDIYTLLVEKKEGPAVIFIPDNIFTRSVDAPPFSPPEKLGFNKKNVYPGINPADYIPSEYNSSVIIAGRQASGKKEREALKKMAEKINCTMVTAPDAKDVFDNFSPLYRGNIGIMGNPSAHEAIDNADTLFVIGENLNETDSSSLDLSGKKILYAGTLPFFADSYTHISESVTEGCRLLSEKIKPYEGDNSGSMTVINSSSNIYVKMMNIIEREIDYPVNFAVDAGNTGAYAVHNIRVSESSNFIIPLGTGGMGHSFAAAIGATKANNKKGCLIAGDGAFLLNGLEIHTAVEYSLPVIFIIFDNSGYKLCTQREKLYFNEVSSCNDFSAISIADGMKYMFPTLLTFDIYSENELKNALRKCRNTESPVLISIRIKDSELPPFLPFHNI